MRKRFFIFILVAAVGACDDSPNNNNNVNQEICDNGIDDDSDTYEDCRDSDCFSDPYCTGDSENNCNDGLDNDGDGKVDCDDSDCTLACSADECTAQWVFWESPEVCPDGTVCAFTGTEDEAACLDEAQFSGGTYYGPCGPQGECPKGSVCLDFYYGMEPLCMVSCYEPEPYSDTCPDGGTCSFQSDDTYFNWPRAEKYRFCAQLDVCDPVLGTGCPENESCYLISHDFAHTQCLPKGSLESGDICEYPNDCLPGYNCFNYGFVCGKVCNWQDNTGCEEGYYCYAIMDDGYGLCREVLK